MAQQPKGWHRETIKAELRKQFGPITHLSAAWGYARPAITNCLLNPNYSRPLERRIAEALEQSPHVLWPDRWDRRGNPLPRVSDRNDGSANDLRKSQKRAAA